MKLKKLLNSIKLPIFLLVILGLFIFLLSSARISLGIFTPILSWALYIWIGYKTVKEFKFNVFKSSLIVFLSVLISGLLLILIIDGLCMSSPSYPPEEDETLHDILGTTVSGSISDVPIGVIYGINKESFTNEWALLRTLLTSGISFIFGLIGSYYGSRIK